jgi:hypothetical protein
MSKVWFDIYRTSEYANGSNVNQEATVFEDLRERATADIQVEETESTNALEQLLESINPKQRFILSLMLLFNVIVLGCMCLVAAGRIQF